MLPLNVTLSYYKRRDVQEEIIKAAENREVAVKYDDKFGNRPDVLNNPNDILELAKQKATSFHCSEELWSNALQLNPELKRHEIEKLRVGWDLVLDIDSPEIKLSKIISWLIIKSLRDHDIRNISIKYSGNKGFHVGIPFESFPDKIEKIPIKNIFPTAPRKIAFYLLDYISRNYILIQSDKIVFGDRYEVPIDKIIEYTNKSINEIFSKHCSNCNSPIDFDVNNKNEFICSKCGSIIVANESYMKCLKCNIFMEKFEKDMCKCGSKEYYKKFNTEYLINVDTILISSRHLFRMPYSLHEKSGLVSLPLNPDEVLNFKKEDADPKHIKISKFRFLDRERVAKGEARKLLMQAFDFSAKMEEGISAEAKTNYEIKDAMPENFFPPCIKLISNGLADGRKRALFILINFLSSLGWGYDNIEKYLKEWNKKNTEPLRENYLVCQLRYHKSQKKKILPPNCNNMMYYVNIGVCRPDNLCSKIKNPVSYSIRKSLFAIKEEKNKGKPL